MGIVISARHFFLVLIIVIAFGLRVIKLDSLPLSLSLDEATNGLDTFYLFRLSWLTPFLQNNFGRETLFFYLQLITLKLYGISFFSLRFASVLAGTITVPLLYIVGQKMRLKTATTTNIVGLIAATGLAVSYWHIYFSRVGLRAIMLPTLLLGLVYCFWQGWYGEEGKKRLLWLFVAGLLLGLSFYLYLAARLLPFLFVTFFIVELAIKQSSDKVVTNSKINVGFRASTQPAYLAVNRGKRIEKVTGFSVFVLATAIITIPLAHYFYQNPQAFASRAGGISIIAPDIPPGIILTRLIANIKGVLQIHFMGGVWLGQWPSLNLISAIGFVVGLPLCIYHLKKPQFLFLSLWWVVGIAPVLLSKQDWQATTTILRGVIAWPALFLISAVGLSAIATKIRPVFTALQWRKSFPQLILPLLLLLYGGLSSGYNYFNLWATNYNRFSDHPAYMARYLNRQTEQLTLTPLTYYAENVGHLLLQSQYPTLSNIDPVTLRKLLASNRPAVYLLPDKSTAVPVFLLLVPAPNGRGTAYLLPPLTPSQTEALSNQAARPIGVVADSEQEPIARIYPLSPSAPFLFSADESAKTKKLSALFDDNIRLTGYRVEPNIIKPGESVNLTLDWQVEQPLDGDYYLFIHLFNITENKRYGQINSPLAGMLFNAHLWPVGLIVPDKHYFTLPPDAPEGIYRFEVGLYHSSSEQRLAVRLDRTSEQSTAQDSIILGKLRLQRQPPAPPQYPLTGLQFGENIALIGADFPTISAPVQPGQSFDYNLYWQAIAPISKSYTVFTHLLNSEAVLQAQQDNIPQRGHYPTNLWDGGEIVVDPYTISLPPHLKPGNYTIRVGLYKAETGERLPLKGHGRDFFDFPTFVIE